MSEDEDFEQVDSEDENGFQQHDDDDDDGVTVTTLDGSEPNLKFPSAAIPDVVGSGKKRKNVKVTGFQSMGLFPELLKAILKIGYNVPTPIQRKAIPIAMSGSDLVAMARTGSGKTAAFLIPIIQSLRAHSTKVGSRALILAPTRELANQTFKFALQLCKLTDLRFCLLVGGERMENQFGLLAQNPDIIIATPGRLMHHIAEIGMTLRLVEFLVFDEADRLFEMGFAPQINEIMKAMSEKRQTLLFSATMPGLLADFARAGLHNPVMVRLDVEAKLSENLQLAFIAARAHDKSALLLYLLKDVIPNRQKTVIFAATKHHVEFYHALLRTAGVFVTAIYGSMDQSARKIAIAKFRAGKVDVLVVTDVAARGIDIPLLDNVINCDFPATSKLFVHRVGRVARAGRNGRAFSLVGTDETAYMVDLNLFLGRNVTSYTPQPGEDGYSVDAFAQSYFGCLPQDVLDVEAEWVKDQIASSVELQRLERSMKNAYKLYHRTRPPPSPESVRRAKALPDPPLHPLVLYKVDQDKHEQLDFLKGIKRFRPAQTIFEARMTNQGATSEPMEVMSKKRAFHTRIIEKEAKRKAASSSAAKAEEEEKEEGKEGGEDSADVPINDEGSSSSRITQANRRQNKRKQEKNFVDEEFYLSSFHASNSFSEKGLAIREHGISSDAVFEVAPDEATEEQKQKRQFRWDRKDKKYKKHVPHEHKVKVDTQFYKEWTKSTHARIQREGEEEVKFNVANAQKRFGLSKEVEEVNKKVHTGYKNRQLKPTHEVKSGKLKVWKQQATQDAKKKERQHTRMANQKKGNVSFKSKHKFKASSMSKKKGKSGK